MATSIQFPKTSYQIQLYTCWRVKYRSNPRNPECVTNNPKTTFDISCLRHVFGKIFGLKQEETYWLQPPARPMTSGIFVFGFVRSANRRLKLVVNDDADFQNFPKLFQLCGATMCSSFFDAKKSWTKRREKRYGYCSHFIPVTRSLLHQSAERYRRVATSMSKEGMFLFNQGTAQSRCNCPKWMVELSYGKPRETLCLNFDDPFSNSREPMYLYQ